LTRFPSESVFLFLWAFEKVFLTRSLSGSASEKAFSWMCPFGFPFLFEKGFEKGFEWPFPFAWEFLFLWVFEKVFSIRSRFA